ncbi:MAG: hypothetical protein E7004_00915 [Alphaproteobacteria bacterium]|nr:hypothetical protein [Alphaproteobacteria bacterium]
MNKIIKKIVKKSGSSFFWGMHMLPTKERRAIYTLYAFCRHIDDIVDGNEAMSHKIELINAWKKEIDNIYDKKVPASCIGRNIYKNCMRFNIPKSDLTSLLSSISMDLPNPVQAPSMDDFYKYCQGVACAPGSMSLRVLGCKDEQLIKDLSTSLGVAMQVTNILRDVREDAMVDRLYIPKEFLLKAGIESVDPKEVIIDKNLSVAREELAKLAFKQYEKSFDLISKLDKKISRSIKALAYVYKRYFDIMQNRGWEVISPKPSISHFLKLLLVLKAYTGR